MPERMYLYIMGRGHSGSTILDILLGGNADVESIGELASGLAGYHHGMICACGCVMRDCPFWTEVRHRFEEQGLDWDELIRATTTQAHLRSQPGTWLARSDDAKLTRLAQLTEGLQKAVAGRTGKTFLLDSGKEVTRALFLLRFSPRARVIHLVRDPRAVQQSHYWRIAERRGFKFLRHKYQATWTGPFFLVLAAASWLVGNLLAEAVCRVAPGRTVRLRYEDLRDDPVGTLRDRQRDRVPGPVGRSPDRRVGHEILRKRHAVLEHQQRQHRACVAGIARPQPSGETRRLPGRWRALQELGNGAVGFRPDVFDAQAALAAVWQRRVDDEQVGFRARVLEREPAFGFASPRARPGRFESWVHQRHAFGRRP